MLERATVISTSLLGSHSSSECRAPRSSRLLMLKREKSSSAMRPIDRTIQITLLPPWWNDADQSKGVGIARFDRDLLQSVMRSPLRMLTSTEDLTGLPTVALRLSRTTLTAFAWAEQHVCHTRSRRARSRA